MQAQMQAQPESRIRLHPGTMRRIATIDERFQSYNVEMVEVTGGRFWKPYRGAANGSGSTGEKAAAKDPAGLDAAMFQYRPPINLADRRLRTLAAALGPAYVRVSGTWQNTTYFQDRDAPPPATPPVGFSGVLTRTQWKGVIDFSHAVDARIITSFATSAGARDSQGVWTPGQAERFLAYTKASGGAIAAAEFMNEPNMPSAAGVGDNYSPQAYARDLAIFKPMLKKASPDTLLLGVGSVGEGTSLLPAGMRFIASEDLLRATGPIFDGISYHFYGAVSTRCAAMMGAQYGTTQAAALSAEWLNRTVVAETFYAGLRDRFEPGRPLWVTETGEAACGGDVWASTFVDTFRYLNQLGALAQRGVQVVAHNTLAASDYALLDAETFRPRPNYWAALLWRRMMGTVVLDPGAPAGPDVHLYAHCLRGVSGGVSLLVVNASQTHSFTLEAPAPGSRYTLTAHDLLSREVELNGSVLELGEGDNLPALIAVTTLAGTLEFAPASVAFVAFPTANNAACKP
jgi:hypothetical protein